MGVLFIRRIKVLMPLRTDLEPSRLSMHRKNPKNKPPKPAQAEINMVTRRPSIISFHLFSTIKVFSKLAFMLSTKLSLEPL